MLGPALHPHLPKITAVHGVVPTQEKTVLPEEIITSLKHPHRHVVVAGEEAIALIGGEMIEEITPSGVVLTLKVIKLLGTL